MLKKLLNLYLSISHAVLKAFDTLLMVVRKLVRWAATALIPLLICWYVIGTISDRLEFSDKDPQRGAAAITNDPIDKDVAKENIRYLEQNWRAEDSLWFYRASQGSNLLPYAFFMHLEQPGNEQLFKSNEHINRFRYLPQDATKSNPDALPVGMAKDRYLGDEYIGLTCSACHTSQINYVGADKVAKAIRVDGGPAAADLEQFLLAMASALEETIAKPEKRARFYKAVMQSSDYKSEQQIDNDLAKYATKLRAYTQINEPVWKEGGNQGITHYGFSRLDAFGRIYNRVQQYIIRADQLKRILQRDLPPIVWERSNAELEAIFEGGDQTNLVLRALAVVNQYKADVSPEEWQAAFERIRDDVFNPANAPASYPYLWDIAQHDFVQWTGLVSNGGIGPLGRNVGQVIGVFGTLDWQEKPGWSVSSYLGGQGIEEQHIDFQSSIDKRNLARVENHLRKLWSPQWPVEFAKLDPAKMQAGKVIFDQRCASCHANIVRDDPERRVIANITKLSAIGTDPVLAKNTTKYAGFGGLLQGEYVETAGGEIVIEERQSTASLVKFSTKNVVTSWDPDKWLIRRMAEWTWDFLKAAKNNDIRGTLRRGNYEPATAVNPLKPIESYKARSLNGIWATAPYLHNGSVPNLYELLLPKKRVGSPEFDANGNKIEYRSDTFLVGSREFDQDKVGFRSAGYSNEGFLFDTSLRGNSNAGHEYAAGITPNVEKFRPNLTHY